MNASVTSMRWLRASGCIAAHSAALLSHEASAADPAGDSVRSDRPQHAPRPALCRVDLGVLPIEFTLERRIDQLNGRVKITAKVKNLGQAPFESRPGQQALYRYQEGKQVAAQPIVNLRAGQVISVSYVRPWYARMTAPPTYKAEVGYDPDIPSDANPRNDDCHPSHNSVSRPGSEITELF